MIVVIDEYVYDRLCRLVPAGQCVAPTSVRSILLVLLGE